MRMCFTKRKIQKRMTKINFSYLPGSDIVLLFSSLLVLAPLPSFNLSALVAGVLPRINHSSLKNYCFTSLPHKPVAL